MTLRTRLDDLASQSPGHGAIDVERLRGRIARRRRGRLAAAGGAMALTVAAAGAAVATLVPGFGGGPEAEDVPVATSAPGQREFRFGECGDPITTGGPAPDGPLRLTVELRAPTPVGGDGVSLGTVTVTNTGDEVVAGSTGDGPGIVLAEPGGGRVSAQEPVHPMVRTVELEPGESLTDDLVLYRYRCVPGEPVDQPRGPVPMGRGYEAYVAWGMTTDDGVDLTLYGGPFAVEL
ncbi:hypothetical protein [Jiangella endophytica]|uniref:hypothetical protein n=1 Tax=Jiangella endophytica TaxID=1623398 RepID=UPI000E3458AC|nr:hypothetical protein [Jiangella endophytica]